MASSTKTAAPKKVDSTVKHARKSLLRKARNTSVFSQLKTGEKKLLKAIEEEAAHIGEAFGLLTSMLDKAVKQGILHKNAAARKKSIFNKRVTAGKIALPKGPVRPKAAKGESAKDKSKAKAKIRAKAKAKK